MEKIYIVESETGVNGMVLKQKPRYIRSLEKANEVFVSILNDMKYVYSDMISDKENYTIDKSNRKGNRYYCCSYKYQPQMAYFSVGMTTETLE